MLFVENGFVKVSGESGFYDRLVIVAMIGIIGLKFVSVPVRV